MLDCLDAHGERFTDVAWLGAGAFGEVHRAFDHQRGTVVALKVLRHLQPAQTAQLKNEFRSLAEVSHPNLVQLYDLLTGGDRVFFTMQYIEGRPFDAYVADGAARAAAHTAPTLSLDAGGLTRLDPPPVAPAGRLLRGHLVCRDHDRLRAALRSLVRGVQALHGYGLIHRDLKPANVLVSPSGRVVVLDFGLVRSEGALAEPGVHGRAGTPTYMSPEQIRGAPLGPATDWYSVGVMLYHALTGQSLFDEDPPTALARRGGQDPPPPSSRVAGVPPDLDRLCRDLLDRRPEHRPHADAILARLGGSADGAPSLTGPIDHPLIGRADALTRLDEALGAARAGGAVLVHVGGVSGIGKTALVEAFARRVRPRGDALLLRGRCHEREGLPFKAVDGVIEALAAELARREPDVVAAMLPPGIVALARLFPTFAQVDAIAARCPAQPLRLEPREIRDRAMAGLRGLLGALSAQRTVVMIIDDLQWGDVDGARVLSELVRPPGAPPILVVATYRVEESETSDCLRFLLGPDGAAAAGADVRDVELGRLSAPEVTALVEAIAADLGLDLGPDAVRAIAEESSGSPLFVSELVQRARTFGPTVSTTRPAADDDVRFRLDALIADRVQRLPPETRRLLQVVSVAGRPIARGLLATAAGSASPEADGLLRLRAERFVRVRVIDGREDVECYHDRIRETVAAALDTPTRRAVHGDLAEALERTSGSDPESLAMHLGGSGQPERAHVYARMAADQAAATLAFDRATRLYRQALALHRPPPAELRALRIALAESLRDTGRGIEAAHAFLAAADGAPTETALRLTQQAGVQLLFAGRLEHGVSVLGQVTGQIGSPMPRSRLTALASIVANRLRLRWRGRAPGQPASAAEAEFLSTRVDLLWECGVALAQVDNVAAIAFQTRAALLAYALGEPGRMARAVGLDAVLSAVGGRRGRARADRLMSDARALAERSDHPESRIFIDIVAADKAWTEGRWPAVIRAASAAIEGLRAEYVGVNWRWQLDLAHTLAVDGLHYGGRWRELCAQVQALMREARDRGDRYLESQLRLRVGWYVGLITDRPDAARAALDTYAGSMPGASDDVTRTLEAIGRALTDLYAGAPAQARARFSADISPVGRWLIDQVPIFSATVRFARARVELACARRSSGSVAAGHRQRARAEARRVRRTGVAMAAPLAELIEALAGVGEVPTQRLAERLWAAERGFERVGMPQYAVACRWRRGEVSGGARGERLVGEATAWMVEQQVQRPERMIELLAPCPARRQ